MVLYISLRAFEDGRALQDMSFSVIIHLRNKYYLLLLFMISNATSSFYRCMQTSINDVYKEFHNFPVEITLLYGDISAEKIVEPC